MNHSQVWIGLISASIPESNPKLAFRNGCIIAKLRIGLVYHILYLNNKTFSMPPHRDAL